MKAEMESKKIRLFGVDIDVSITGDCEGGGAEVPADVDHSGFSGGSSRTNDTGEKEEKSVLTRRDQSDVAKKMDTSRLHGADDPTADNAPVYNPTPQRCFPEIIYPESGLSHGGTITLSFQESEVNKGVEISVTDRRADPGLDSSTSVARTTGEKGRKSKKRKGQGKEVGKDEKKGISGKRTRRHDRILEPIPSLEEIPGILETVRSNNGTTPEFLYRKSLQVSDVRANQNRLFMTHCEDVLKFLTEEERNQVDDTSKGGLEVSAVDSKGDDSYRLHIVKWPSLNIVVLNSDWIKLVRGSNAQEGYVVQLWGYRQSDELRLGVNFKKPEAEETQGDAGSSGSTDGGNSTV